MLPCVECGVDIDEDVWHEEFGMCVDCSNEYFTHEDVEVVA